MNNNKIRCPWVPLDKPDYVEYHDKEWGFLFMMTDLYSNT